MKIKQIQSVWHGAERCKKCAIRHLVLFADLEYEDFDRIHYPIDEIEYESGQRLYYQGDRPPFVYTIRSGLIKLVQSLPNGNVRIVRLLRQGDLAGLEGIDGQAMDHEAVAMDQVKTCRIPKSVVESLRRDNPILHKALMHRWQSALSNANIWITQLSTGNSKERVARLLLLLEQASNDGSIFLPAREDIGSMLGITTESASKATAEFKRNDWLKPMPHNRAWIDVAQLKLKFAFEE